ncbi:MAG: hypothetical protein KIS62_01440 [Ramlibacter sp.]|nr:hypothetical protein [Ramlibacter sp.]
MTPVSTFQDPNFADYSLALDVERDGAMTSSAFMLVRLNDIRPDESGNLPGEKFASASLTRLEVRQMLRHLDADMLDTLRYTGSTQERRNELAYAIDAVLNAASRLCRVIGTQWKRGIHG